ncbi:hypothetical protein G5S52_17745 [Grimontia sp. S25]|uniref:DUF3887 domain-containing protein n=1 Tax=Grimontia sedimenti TaxID=2711294 RepID=A0A6M1RAY5_9GAMM|nr:hypothetical protein [Grimontia sedimenti]NGN99423.1 hypothetical protein [Grimontia sedimenti]
MKFLLAICIFVISFNSSSSERANLDELTKPIFDSLKSGKIEKIPSLALSNSKIIKYFSEVDLEQFDTQFASEFKVLGKYYSHSLIHEQGIEGAFWAKWYLLKFERQPIVLYVEFYRPDETWGIQSIKLKNDVDDMIEKSGDYEIGTLGIED